MTAPSAFLEDLRQVGVDVTDPWDLVNTRSSYRPAIPVLLRWLALADSDVPAHERDRFREAVVRSLGVKEARGHAAPALVEEFRRPGSSPDVRWAAGNALSVVADDGVFDDLVLLARDRSYGRAREMLPLALARTKHPEAVQVLLELLDDDEIAGHVVMALGKLGRSEARSAIEPLVEHPKPWVRREAKKALQRLAG